MNNLLLEKDIILGIIHDTDFLSKICELDISPKDFDKGVFRWVFEKSVSFFKNPDFGRTKPTKTALLSFLQKEKFDEQTFKKYHNTIRSLFKEQKPENLAFLYKESQTFKKTKRFIKQLEKTVDLVDKTDNIDEVISSMGTFILNNSEDQKEWESRDWLDGFEKRQEHRKFLRENPEENKCLHFGIEKLDKRIPRGLLPGNLASISAKTNVGKSIFCNHIGYNALLQNLNVIHVITENEFDQIEGRYDARATSIPYDDLQMYDFDGEKDFLLERAEKFINMLRNKTRGSLQIVKCIPNKTTILTIYNAIYDFETKRGIKTDVLIIDSPELMNSLAPYKEYRLQKASVYWEIKSLLLEKNIIGFVSSQLKASTEDELPTAEDMSEAYDKSRMLDVMLVLARTQKQVLTEEANLHLVKTRDSAKDGVVLTLKPDYATMFMDTR